jgi:hypothetical protein
MASATLTRSAVVNSHASDVAKVKNAVDPGFTGSQAVTLKQGIVKGGVGNGAIFLPVASRGGERITLDGIDRRCAMLEAKVGTDSSRPDVEHALRKLEERSRVYRHDSASMKSLLVELESEVDLLVDEYAVLLAKANTLHLRTAQRVRKVRDLLPEANAIFAELSEIAFTSHSSVDETMQRFSSKPNLEELERSIDALEVKLERHQADCLAQVDALQSAVFAPTSKQRRP